MTINYNALYIHINNEYIIVPEEISDNKKINKNELTTWVVKNNITSGTVGYFMNIDNKFKYIAIENVSDYFMKSNVVEINTSEDKIYANMNNENTSFINQIKKVKDVDDNQGNKNAINFGVAAIGLNILNLIIPFVHIVGMIIAVFGLFNSKSSEGKYASAIILNAIAFCYGIFNIFLGVILYGY